MANPPSAGLGRYNPYENNDPTASEELGRVFKDYAERKVDRDDPVSDDLLLGVQKLVNPVIDVALDEQINTPTSPLNVRLNGKVDKSDVRLNAADFGVVGDGITNDRPALQAAINAAAGRALFIPSGRYLIDAALSIPSNTTVEGELGTTIVSTNEALANFFFTFGSWGTPVEISAAVGVGATQISTKTPHGLNVGDVFKIQSQRIATSSDAGDWRLGWSTGTGAGPFFGEYATVYSVPSSTTVEIDTGLVFPGYRPDRTQETDAAAADSATISKFNAVSNITIRNLNLEGPASTAIRFRRAIDCVVENVRYIKPNAGRFIQFDETYRCEGRDCFVRNDFIVVGDANHDASNSYHIVASQSSGFDRCSVVRGSQCFDITYSSTSRIPSLFCYVKNCSSFSALFNPITVHPGTYAARIIGNNFSECRQSGISIRANKSIVSNNVVQGTGGVDRYGIYILEGGGKGSIISGNTVIGFQTALGVIDGANKPYGNSWIGVTFHNNVVEDFALGLRRFISFGTPLATVRQGIIVSNNTFRSSNNTAVAIDTAAGRGVNGMTVRGNTFDLTGGVNTVGVQVSSNAHNILVVNNTFNNVGMPISRDTSQPHTLGERTFVSWKGNEVIGALSGSIPFPDSTFTLESFDPSPMTIRSGEFNLNDFTHTGTWRTSASADATLARNFPGDGFSGWLDVRRLISTSVMQYFYRITGSSHELYARRLNGTTWTAWQRAYLTAAY